MRKNGVIIAATLAIALCSSLSSTAYAVAVAAQVNEDPVTPQASGGQTIEEAVCKAFIEKISDDPVTTAACWFLILMDPIKET